MRLKFFYVGVSNYKLFFIAASSPLMARRIAKKNIPFIQRWRKIKAIEDIDPVPLSDRGYQHKLVMVDYVEQ